MVFLKSRILLRLEIQLKDVHTRLSQDPVHIGHQQEEARLQKELGGWLSLEEKEIRQKSRESWLELGNRNSKFFHAAYKVRNHKTVSLSSSQDSSAGIPVINILELREEALQHSTKSYSITLIICQSSLS